MVTEPRPFHFRTEERSLAHRANTRAPIVVCYDPPPVPLTKKPWSSALTEPKEFSFATAQRAAEREISKVFPVNRNTAHQRKKMSPKVKARLSGEYLGLTKHDRTVQRLKRK